jgi:predicted outer membrane lipoprotein
VLLKGSNHHFLSDPEWGELFSWLRLGLLIKEDYTAINAMWWCLIDHCQQGSI